MGNAANTACACREDVALPCDGDDDEPETTRYDSADSAALRGVMAFTMSEEEIRQWPESIIATCSVFPPAPPDGSSPHGSPLREATADSGFPLGPRVTQEPSASHVKRTQWKLRTSEQLSDSASQSIADDQPAIAEELSFVEQPESDPSTSSEFKHPMIAELQADVEAGLERAEARAKVERMFEQLCNRLSPHKYDVDLYSSSPAQSSREAGENRVPQGSEPDVHAGVALFPRKQPQARLPGVDQTATGIETSAEEAPTTPVQLVTSRKRSAPTKEITAQSASLAQAASVAPAHATPGSVLAQDLPASNHGVDLDTLASQASQASPALPALPAAALVVVIDREPLHASHQTSAQAVLASDELHQSHEDFSSKPMEAAEPAVVAGREEAVAFSTALDEEAPCQTLPSQAELPNISEDAQHAQEDSIQGQTADDNKAAVSAEDTMLALAGDELHQTHDILSKALVTAEPASVAEQESTATLTALAALEEAPWQTLQSQAQRPDIADAAQHAREDSIQGNTADDNKVTVCKEYTALVLVGDEMHQTQDILSKLMETAEPASVAEQEAVATSTVLAAHEEARCQTLRSQAQRPSIADAAQHAKEDSIQGQTADENKATAGAEEKNLVLAGDELHQTHEDILPKPMEVAEPATSTAPATDEEAPCQTLRSQAQSLNIDEAAQHAQEDSLQGQIADENKAAAGAEELPPNVLHQASAPDLHTNEASGDVQPATANTFTQPVDPVCPTLLAGQGASATQEQAPCQTLRSQTELPNNAEAAQHAEQDVPLVQPANETKPAEVADTQALAVLHQALEKEVLANEDTPSQPVDILDPTAVRGAEAAPDSTAFAYWWPFGSQAQTTNVEEATHHAKEDSVREQTADESKPVEAETPVAFHQASAPEAVENTSTRPRSLVQPKQLSSYQILRWQAELPSIAESANEAKIAEFAEAKAPAPLDRASSQEVLADENFKDFQQAVEDTHAEPMDLLESSAVGGPETMPMSTALATHGQAPCQPTRWPNTAQAQTANESNPAEIAEASSSIAFHRVDPTAASCALESAPCETNESQTTLAGDSETAGVAVVEPVKSAAKPKKRVTSTIKWARASTLRQSDPSEVVGEAKSSDPEAPTTASELAATPPSDSVWTELVSNWFACVVRTDEQSEQNAITDQTLDLVQQDLEQEHGSGVELARPDLEEQDVSTEPADNSNNDRSTSDLQLLEERPPT